MIYNHGDERTSSPPIGSAICSEILAGIGYASAAKRHEALVAIADENESIGVPRDNLLLYVVEVPAEDWYSPGFDGIE